MTHEWWLLRFRQVLDRWFVLVAVALVLVMVAGVSMAYVAHTNPGTETVTEREVVFEEHATLNHQAEVQRSAWVFAEGEIVDGPTYFTSVSPNLDAIHRYTIRHADDVNLTVETEFRLIVRSEQDGTELWRDTVAYGEDAATLEQPGGGATTSITVNVTEIDDRVENIERGLQSSAGSVESFLDISAHAHGTVDGESYSRFHDLRMTIDPGGDTYSVDVEEPMVRTEEREVVVAVIDQQPSFLAREGAILLSLVAAVGLVGLAAGRHTGWTSISQERLRNVAHAKERASFEDWISVGSVPHERLQNGHPSIEVESLEDLVDIAADTDSRVIEDQRTGRYVVLNDRDLFTFTPPHARISVPPSMLVGALEKPIQPHDDGERVADGGEDRE